MLAVTLMLVWSGAQFLGYQDMVEAAGTNVQKTTAPSDEQREKEQRLASKYENLVCREADLEERLNREESSRDSGEDMALLEQELDRIRFQKEKIMQECFDK